jgi:hypothetical protein
MLVFCYLERVVEVFLLDAEFLFDQNFLPSAPYRAIVDELNAGRCAFGYDMMLYCIP